MADAIRQSGVSEVTFYRSSGIRQMSGSTDHEVPETVGGSGSTYTACRVILGTPKRL
jgi:hypothetical protein